MAVLFFEGFNRALRSDLWTVVAGSGGTPYLTGGGRSGGGYLIMPADSTDTAKVQSIVTNQTNKKIYVGFAVISWVAPLIPDDRKYLTFVGAAGAELFSVFFDGTDTENSTTAGLMIKQNNVDVARFLVTTATNVGSITVNGQYYHYNGYYIAPQLQGWNYFEFEIDLVNNTVAIRRNGMPLFVETTNASTLTLTTPITSFTGIAFRGNTYGGWGVDDMYIVDDTGTAANTWLGPTVEIHSPNFDSNSGNPTEWTNNNYSAATAFNADNGDSGYIGTTVFNQTECAGISISPTPASVLVGGIIMSSKARNVSLDAAYYQVYTSTTLQPHALSPKITLTGATYTKTYTFSTLNPETNEPWTLLDIIGGTFGVQSANPAA